MKVEGNKILSNKYWEEVASGSRVATEKELNLLAKLTALPPIRWFLKLKLQRPVK